MCTANTGCQFHTLTSDSTASWAPEQAFLPQRLQTLEPAKDWCAKKNTVAIHTHQHTQNAKVQKNLNKNAHGIQLNVLLSASENKAQTKTNIEQ